MGTTHKLLAAIAIFFSLAVPALAQSNPGLTYGFVPTAAQWNAYFSSKQDYLGAAACSTAGCTMSGELVTAAPTAATSGFNLPPGTPPSSPINGDLWTTASNLYVRINGTTYALISSGGTVNSGTTGQITYYAATGTAVSGSSAITISGGVPSIASPTITGTATGPDSGTWTSGGINGSVIGATTPEAGTFTTLQASGAATVGTLTAQAGYELTVNGTIAVNVSSTYYEVGYTSGTLTNGHCVSIGSNGTLIDAGGACTTGGGGGTVNAGTAGQIAYYVSSTNAVSGTSVITIASGVAAFAFGTGAASTINATSANTGFTNEIISSNTGTSSNAATVAEIGAQLGCSNCSVSLQAIGGSSPSASLVSGSGLTGGFSISTLAGSLSLASPTFTGTVTGPDSGTWTSGGINGSVIGATTAEAGTFTTLKATTSVNVNSGGSYQINGTSVLNATTLGSGVTASSLTSVGTVSSGTWEAALGGTITGNATLSGNLTLSGNNTLSGTDNFTGTFEVAGNAMTFPGSAATLASLNITDQTLTGGTNVTSDNLGTISSGTTTIDCGARPLQYLTNGGAFTLAAPSNDGSCVIKVTNNASAGTITLSGFSSNSPFGSAYATTNAESFDLFIARVNGTAVAIWTGPL